VYDAIFKAINDDIRVRDGGEYIAPLDASGSNVVKLNAGDYLPLSHLKTLSLRSGAPSQLAVKSRLTW
jgi:hypothetical protein